MNEDKKLTQLEEYRAQALEQLMQMSDYLVSNEDVDYSTVLNLAQSTANPELFGKALEKIKQIEDQQERSDALLGYLDAIEYSIAGSVHGNEIEQVADSHETEEQVVFASEEKDEQ